MATSSNPTFAQLTPRNQVVAHVSLKVAQAMSMLVPPGYVVYTLARRGKGARFSINRLMRLTTSNVVIGAGVGAAMGYARLRNEPEDAIVDRCERLKSNAGQVHTDDYSAIGAFLGALLGPAIFLKRAPTPALIIGGASIGLGAGVWTHIVKSFTQGEEVKPAAMAAELPPITGVNK